MFEIVYSQGNSGEVIHDVDSMTDLVSMLESGFNFPLNKETMMALLSGEKRQVNGLTISISSL